MLSEFVNLLKFPATAKKFNYNFPKIFAESRSGWVFRLLIEFIRKYISIDKIRLGLNWIWTFVEFVYLGVEIVEFNWLFSSRWEGKQQINFLCVDLTKLKVYILNWYCKLHANCV